MTKSCILIVTLLLAGCSTIPRHTDRYVEPTDNARERLDTAIERQDPELRQAADDAYARNDWEAARTSYELLVRQYPAEAEYWYRLGNIYSFTDKLDAAVICYREALELNSKITGAWLNLGMTQLKQAAYSFNGMQAQYPAQSAESTRAQHIIEAILELLQTNK